MASRQMNALIVGGGGREHQLALSIAGSVNIMYITGGNAGTEMIDNAVNLPFGATALGNIVDLASQKETFTIVGPEMPLIQGLADRLRERGLLVFGPGADGAQMEGSKRFAHYFNQEFGIPEPKTYVATSYQEALKIMGSRPIGRIPKADGPAGGKGVIIPKTRDEARAVAAGMLDGSLVGGAGKDCIVYQEKLHGDEVSVTAICDGENFTVLPNSQDHKRLLDGDKGPNTGGMGAYAPVPATIISADQQAKIDSITEKAVDGMRQRGMNYRGVLYIGMMLADEYQGDPVVLEYNARFGDPETQVVLPLLEQKGVNVHDLLYSAAAGNLPPEMHLNKLVGGAALTVCIVDPDYPNTPRTGAVIHGLGREYPSVIVQHGGTKFQGEDVITNGGRVLYVTGLGQSHNEAANNAYAAIGEENGGIYFEDMHYRRRIGDKVREP